MGRRLRRVRAGGLLRAAALATAVGSALVSPTVASAHGGPVNIGVSCMTPDTARPLAKVCTAAVTYGDGHQVTDARLSLTASREDGDRRSFGPVPFQAAGEEGVYTAAFQYPAYGKWLVEIEAVEPGSGRVELREEILPPLPGAVGSEASEARVRIVLDFNSRELANIVVRAVHLGAATAWFAVSVLVLAASLFLSGPQRESALRSLAAWFPWVAGAAFLVLAGTGSYIAVYNVPARTPGLFDPDLLQGLPFGTAYLMVFAAKMGLTAAIVAGSGAMAIALRRGYISPLRPIAGGALATSLPVTRVERWVVGLSLANMALGVFVLIDVVVLGYLHILTHIGGFSGAR